MPSLSVSNLSKQYIGREGPKPVLHQVSLEVPEGETVCLLGPNGSGKTTLLKVISTLLTPNSGEVRLGDLNVHTESSAAKRLIGFASSEDHSFYGRLTVQRNLWFYAQLFGLDKTAWKKRLDQLAAELELGPFLDQPFRELSNGQKQRVLLARAVVHNPPVLLLDEPHQNLDPHSAIRLRELLRNEWGEKQRKTILFSTHHLEDAMKISDRWVILSQGKVRFQGSVAEAKKASPNFSIEDFFQQITRQEAVSTVP